MVTVHIDDAAPEWSAIVLAEPARCRMPVRAKPNARTVAEMLRSVAIMIESGFVQVVDAEHRERGVLLPAGEYHVYGISVTYGLDSELQAEVRQALGIGSCCKREHGE